MLQNRMQCCRIRPSISGDDIAISSCECEFTSTTVFGFISFRSSQNMCCVCARECGDAHCIDVRPFRSTVSVQRNNSSKTHRCVINAPLWNCHSNLLTLNSAQQKTGNRSGSGHAPCAYATRHNGIIRQNQFTLCDALALVFWAILIGRMGMF